MKRFLSTLLVAASCSVPAATLYCDQETEGRVVVNQTATNPRLSSCGTTDEEHVAAASWCLPLHCESRSKCYDTQFREFYKDPVNLQPALSCINRSRGNKPYGEIAGEATEYVGCDIEFDRNVMEPPNDKKAVLAGIVFYVEATYPNLCRWPDGYLDLMADWLIITD